MERKTVIDEPTALTDKDFQQFLSATGEERWKILLAHAERNKKIIQIRRMQKMEQTKNQNQEISKE